MYSFRFLSRMAPVLLLLFGLVSASVTAQTEEDYLHPDQAFRLSAEADGPEAVLVRWDIADGYYLYRSKFKFSTDSQNAALGQVEYPPSQLKNDEFFGDMQVYRDQAVFRIPLDRNAGQTQTLLLNTRSQGCADAGLCYPPQSRSVEVRLVAAEPSSKQPKKLAGLAALGALGQDLGLDQDDGILPVEQAFQFSADVESGEQLRLHWTIADGTYLYQDQIRIKVLNADGVALGEFDLPAAKIKQDAITPEGTIGDLAVYVEKLDVVVPLVRSNPDATDLELQVGYQGCAEVGICYPPQKHQLTLNLPLIAAATAAPAEAVQQAQRLADESGTADSRPAMVSEQDQVAAMLAGGNTWLIVLGFFGVGLLLAFTPCVFPMIPILSGIIAGRGEGITTGQAFRLSLVYVLAMAVTYTVAGVLAGLFGQNLQVMFQNVWILSFFAAVFVLLALSMFGFYELQIPSSWQTRLSEASNRQQAGSYTGAAIMGLLSALIVGPCVAPPLAGALIYIGNTGDWMLGGLGLFALAMGMGAPLLLIGTSAGKFLPRAGSWMDRVKAVFGVGLLAVAIVLLERILPPAVAMLLWGALMIVSAVYMGALKQLQIEASGWDILWKGLGVVLLVYGTLMLVGAAAGGKDTVQPLRGLGFSATASGQPNELHFTRIKTLADLQQRVASASAVGQPVMLDFYADWCVSCKEMERYTFSDPQVIATLSQFLLLQADVTANDDEDQALLQGHFGLPGPPAIIFYDRQGKERKNYRVVGFMKPDRFNTHVQQSIQ